MPEPIPCLWPVRGAQAVDLAAAREALAAADPPLGRVMARCLPCHIPPNGRASVFEALAEAIVYQQLSGKAAATILARVRALFPGPRFPAPAAVLAMPLASLRAAGLSEAKARAFHDLAAHAERGVLLPAATLRRMPVEAVVERLTMVRGVGRWTVEMLLIFKLGHPDVLPAHDLGIRKGLARVLRRRELPDPGEVTTRGERWRPFRSVASWYLWRAAELPPPRSPRRSP